MERLLPVAGRIAEALKSRNQTVVVAESAAGGLISAALLAIPGASAYYLGGGVIYTRQARRVLLALPDRDVQVRGATEAYALIAASTLRKRLEADWAIGESGASGPSGSRYGDPAGHACLAVAGPVTCSLTLLTGDDDRLANMWRFAEAGLDLLEQALKQA